MRLAIVCPYPLDRAPSQRYRWERYLDRLVVDRVEVTVHPLLDESAYGILYRSGERPRKIRAVLGGLADRLEQLPELSRADVVLLHREAFFLGGPWIERAIFSTGTPVVFDFDDAIWMPNVSWANRWIAGLKWGSKTGQILSHCRVALAGNDYLADYARGFCDDVRVLPTIVDTDQYRCPPTANSAGGESAPSPGPATIGWTGSSTTAPYLDAIDDVLGVLQRETGVHIRIIGAPSYRPRSYEAEILPWSSETEVADLCPIDIGVMPLPDEEWARGKCGGKLIQYMGLGKAAVASPVGVNSTIVRHGKNGLLAATPDEWLNALRSLVSDAKLRVRLGTAARRTVEDSYSVEATFPVFLRALQDAAR